MLKNKTTLWGIVLLILLCQCQAPEAQERTISKQETTAPYRPEVDLAELFHAVQMAQIFADSKTFVDSDPLFPPSDILDRYRKSKDQQSFDLSTFVKENFSIPPSLAVEPTEDRLPMVEHLHNLWPRLTRTPDEAGGYSSLLPLPFPYVVPGGRFREVYYWDSYFTMLGLLKSDQDSLMLNMLRNFAFLIDEVGFIPNGNRTYYLGRSQPPFFSSMVMLWADRHGNNAALPFLPQMIKEHEFWMTGSELLTDQHTREARVVRLPDGTVLNRFWDNFAAPRPESYREDFELAQNYPESQREQAYRDLRAGAESGWDYSSRWFSDGYSLDSIITTQIAPVDLNCLLYFLEDAIAQLSAEAKDVETQQRYQQFAQARSQAINTYFWDETAGYYSDYHLTQEETTKEYSAAGMMPLYFQIASPQQAHRAADFLKLNLLHPGGVVSTTKDTGQQWDYPNGWAPQQWIAIQGLRRYQQQALAEEIAKRWTAVAARVYDNTGKMMEKYNVVDQSLDAGGGEYPTQDGFGWTNGVTLELSTAAN